MSVDELVGDFVKQNEHHVRQFAPQKNRKSMPASGRYDTN